MYINQDKEELKNNNNSTILSNSNSNSKSKSNSNSNDLIKKNNQKLSNKNEYIPAKKRFSTFFIDNKYRYLSLNSQPFKLPFNLIKEQLIKIHHYIEQEEKKKINKFYMNGINHMFKNGNIWLCLFHRKKIKMHNLLVLIHLIKILKSLYFISGKHLML